MLKIIDNTIEYSCGCKSINNFNGTFGWTLCSEHDFAVRHMLRDAEQDEVIRLKIASFTFAIKTFVNRSIKLFRSNKKSENLTCAIKD
jgi:hypothetical protein